MTKRLSLVLATVTLAIGCGYFVTGRFIQKSYYDTIARANTQPNIKVNLVNYKRGLFSSNADLTIELGTDTPDNLQVLSLHQVITHGPIIAANGPNGRSIKVLAAQIKTVFGQPWQQNLEEFTATKQPLSVTTLVKFSSQATTWVRFTAVDQTTPSEFHVAWDVINGIIEHDFSFSDYHGFISLPKLTVNNPSWQLDLKNVVLNVDANSKDTAYASSNTLTTESLVYSKQNAELLKFDGITAKLVFSTKDNDLALDLEAIVDASRIVNQNFADDKIKLQANNLNRATLANFSRFTALGAKGTVDMLQQLTVSSTDVTFEMPKRFSEALISYLSYEIYRSSYVGKLDQRPDATVLQDISGSIHKLVTGAVQQQLFLDKGDYYALNFNRSTPQG